MRDEDLNFECHMAHLVIVFKNCCLKRYENYGLKSVVEKHVFSVNKTKKMCLISWFKQHFSMFKKYKICV